MPQERASPGIRGPVDLFDTLARSARDWADRPAVIEGARVLTYGELWREVEAFRSSLAHHGVTPGQGVGVRARNGRALIIAALAALGCGAVVMPLSLELTPAELAETFARAPLATVIADGGSRHPVEGLSRPAVLLDGTPLQVVRRPGAAGPLIPWLPDAAFLRFTSGTTGASKGVILTHADVLERVRAANDGLRLGPGDAVLWVLPMAYHFYVSIVLYLSVGTAVVVCADHLAGTLLDEAERHRATFLYAAPLHIRLLAADTSGRRLPPSLGRVMSVSSMLPVQVARDFAGRFGVPVSQGYGIIEVGLPIMNLRDAGDHPEAIGRPVPSFEVALLDDERRPVGDGETGQLAVRGPGMFAGYLDPPLRREEALLDGFFLTGDLAHRTAEGLIVIDGRCKSLINIAGHKVFPEEVAGILDQHPAVVRSRVSMRPHPQLGEVVHADVQLRVAGAVSAEELRAHCRRHLSIHKVPASVDFVPEVGATPSGKVRHG